MQHQTELVNSEEVQSLDQHLSLYTPKDLLKLVETETSAVLLVNRVLLKL
jgi:hypothetical protein